MFHLYLLCNIYIKMESQKAPSTPPKIPGVNTTELLAPPPQKYIYERAKYELPKSIPLKKLSFNN